MPPPLEVLERLLTIRHFEELLLSLFQAGKLGGTTHTCLGQEYIPVALMSLLREADWTFSNHRGHGHYLARFDDPEGLLAEIMGREGAVCRGVGGSQHIKRDRYLSTGIQGESLPVAVGVALQLKREGNGGLAVPFIGDGTWGQGAVYEALNMAALWQVPLVVAVENNGIAQSTPRAYHTAGSIADRTRAFGIAHHRCVRHDVLALQAELAPLLSHVRSTGSPLVLEFETNRLGSHSKGDDTRNPDDVEKLRQASWHIHYQATFPELFARADERARERIATALAKVETAPPCSWTR